MREDIFARLRIDPGHRTLGQLLQDREAAFYEIQRLRVALDRLQSTRLGKAAEVQPMAHPARETDCKLGTLMRVADVCELLSVSRSTIYKWVAERTFPPPVRISKKAIRWRTDAVEQWRDGLSDSRKFQ